MMKFLIPLVLLIVGTGAGVGAGLFLAPPAADMAEDGADGHGSDDAHEAPTHDVTIEHGHSAPKADGHGADSHDDGHGGSSVAYVKLSNQFILPVMDDGHVEAMIILSIAIEAMEADRSAILTHEPKLRDGFIEALFQHGNLGWFSGDFTQSEPMSLLRKSLLMKAHEIVGEKAMGILILDIARQDV